jgi:transposase
MTQSCSRGLVARTVRLLKPVYHRSKEAQADLAVLKVRRTLVAARTGADQQRPWSGQESRLPGADVRRASLPHEVAQSYLPPELRQELMPLCDTLKELTSRIDAQDERVEQLAEKYPETTIFTAVDGVGPVTAVTYLLTLEDKNRFKNSRAVGPYVGLVPPSGPPIR